MNNFIKYAQWLVLLTLLSLLTAGCANFKPKLEKPEAKVVAKRLVGLTLDSANLEVDIEVYNPNKISLNLGELSYQLVVENQPLLSGQQTQASKLKAGKTQVITLPFSLEFLQLAKQVKNLPKLNEVNYTVTGGVGYDLPLLGRQERSFTTSGSLPVPRLPSIEFGGFSKQHLGLGGMGALVAVKVFNPNSFALNLKQLNYSINLANNQLQTGGKLDELNLPAGQSTQLNLPLDIKFNAKQGLTLVNQLTKGEGLDYQLELSSLLGSDLKLLKDLPFKTGREGKLRF